MSHYKDPYLPTSIMESRRVFFVAQFYFTYKHKTVFKWLSLHTLLWWFWFVAVGGYNLCGPSTVPNPGNHRRVEAWTQKNIGAKDIKIRKIIPCAASKRNMWQNDRGRLCDIRLKGIVLMCFDVFCPSFCVCVCVI